MAIGTLIYVKAKYKNGDDFFECGFDDVDDALTNNNALNNKDIVRPIEIFEDKEYIDEVRTRKICEIL